jgi:putative aldouronate transport system substrate-binding protein
MVKQSKQLSMPALLLALLLLAQIVGPAFAEGAVDGPLTPFAQTIVVTRAGSTSPSVGYIEGESVEDNVATRKYRELLNIDYQCKWVVDETQAGDKLNLAIASDDLPDVFAVNADQLGRLIAAGQIQDMSNAYEQYASDNLRNLLNYGDGIGFLPATMADGRIMGLPKLNDFADNITLMWIRDDWLEKVGLAAPTTYEELVAVAKAFVEKDPDGNGQDDTYGIAIDMSLQQTLDGVSHAFGAYPNIWVEKDGKLAYASIQPEMKDALQGLQAVYQAGLIDNEFAVKDVTKVAEDVAQDKVGIYFGQFWMTLWPLELTRENNPDSRWQPYALPKQADGTMKVKALSPAFSWIVVREGYGHPEAIVKSMNLWYEIWQGEYASWWQGLGKGDYASVWDNMHSYALPAFFDPPLKNVNISKMLRSAFETGDTSGFNTEAETYWAHIQSGTPLGYGYDRIFGLNSAEEILSTQYTDLQYDQFNGLTTSSMTLYKANLDKIQLETFTKIIMGQDITTFETFVNQWLSLGGDKITEEVNAWYETIK